MWSMKILMQIILKVEKGIPSEVDHIFSLTNTIRKKKRRKIPFLDGSRGLDASRQDTKD